MVSDNITGPAPNMSTVPHASSGAYTSTPERAEQSLRALQQQFPDATQTVHRFRDELTLEVPRESLVEIAAFCKTELGYDFLCDLTGNDWPEREERFEVIYQLYSMQHFSYLRLKVRVPESHCHCPTVTSVWRTANWHEREVFDLFGVVFDGHPDLRRILLPADWAGHPLRQDYDSGWEEPEFTVRKVQRTYAKG